MPKLQPAVKTLFFVTPVTPANTPTDYYIDLSQCASLANRRGMRQGLNWAVGSIKIIGTVNGSVSIKKLNETWVTSGAWEKSFRMWNQMNKQVLDTNPSMKPAYYDYKVGFDSDHNFANNLLPSGANLVTAIPGEWVQSTIQLPNDPTSGTTTEFSLHMCGGDTATQKAIIKAYAESRALVTTPEPDLPGGFDTNWMNQLFDTGENLEEIAQDLANDNDGTPYPQSNYPGGGSHMVGEIHDYVSITTSTVGGTSYSKGGMFPCGLIKLTHDSVSATNILIQIDLVPGKTRGYLAEPMTKM